MFEISVVGFRVGCADIGVSSEKIWQILFSVNPKRKVRQYETDALGTQRVKSG
jgi:hypothetical protein